MKTATLSFVGCLMLAVAYSMGYRAGSMDEAGKRFDQEERIEALRGELADSRRAFKEAYDKFVGCVQKGEWK